MVDAMTTGQGCTDRLDAVTTEANNISSTSNNVLGQVMKVSQHDTAAQTVNAKVMDLFNKQVNLSLEYTRK